MIEKSLFEGNRAGIEGGAIKWNFYEPLLRGSDFKNNSATYYGDEIASLAEALVQIGKANIALKALFN